MTDKLIDHICKETNAYAAQKGNYTFKIEPNELKSFLAVLLLSGYIPYPRGSMYCEMSSDSRNTIFASLSTRNRFLDVLQYLHLADNNNLNPSDKFSKVNPLFKMINESCLQNFTPEKNVSIDESMVRYYGRHGCKGGLKRARRYIKDKGSRVEIDQPNSISVYSKTMNGVDRMDQNIRAYMITFAPRSGGGNFSDFVLILLSTMPFNFIVYNHSNEEKKNLICWDLGEKMSRYIMQDFDRIKPCL